MDVLKETKLKMMVGAKPFVKWAGGKSWIREEIGCLLSEYFSNGGASYIEPFVGGGAVLFQILQNYPGIEYAVIGDINKDLIIAYKVIRDNPLELIRLLKSMEKEYLSLNESKRKEYYLTIRDKFNGKELDETGNTALFIFLNKTCYNGLYRVNKKGEFNVSFGKYDTPKICDKETILLDSKLLERVVVVRADFERILEYAKPYSLFYLDPPYKPVNKTSNFTSFSKEGFDDKDQIRLAGFCKRLDNLGHKFILSNSDNELFYDLYSEFKIKKVYAARSINSDINKRGKLTELLVTNL